MSAICHASNEISSEVEPWERNGNTQAVAPVRIDASRKALRVVHEDLDDAAVDEDAKLECVALAEGYG